MGKPITNAEQYVIAKRAADALWSNLNAEEREEAAQGVRWLELVGEVYTGEKRRGRPPGSKNRAAEMPAMPLVNGAAEVGL